LGARHGIDKPDRLSDVPVWAAPRRLCAREAWMQGWFRATGGEAQDRHPTARQRYGISATGPRGRFDELFLAHLPALYPRVLAQVRTRDAADETIHDVYLRLAEGRAWQTIASHPNPVGYLVVAATNLIRDRLRAGPRNESLDVTAAGAHGYTDGGFAEHESGRAAASLLHTLNRKEAAAILLVDIAGHSLSEAGRLLGVAKTTVQANRVRGLQRLRTRCGRGGGTGAGGTGAGGTGAGGSSAGGSSAGGGAE
jgi:DNA-directed RNA polymerase specialized sigma24 family protein